jgi:FkbM family methyltransferase
MHTSAAALWMARKQPQLTRWLLRLWFEGCVRFFPNARTRDHWVLLRLANELGYRIPASATLGNGMKIRVAENDGVGRIILSRGYHEGETVEVLKALLAPGMVFFDAGAHVGQFTLVGSQLVADAGAVHSFEPDPETFRWLSLNVRHNKLSNVHLNQLALSNRTETRQFFLGSPEGMSSNSLAMHKEYSGRKYDVHCTTVDEYMKNKQIIGVDVIKIDVEGAELPMLRGASSLLEREDRPFIIIEFEEGRQNAFGSSCAQLAEFLKQTGYLLFRVGNPPLEEYAPRANDPYSFNLLAVPAKRKDLAFGLLG